jgi:polyisoprenoid-binding protein YceI
MANTTQWAIDPTHSEIQFKVKHLVITTVTGSFTQFEGWAKSDGTNFDGAQVGFTAQTASVNTGNEQRDGHLRSDDFFNADKFPQLTFADGGLRKKADGAWELFGNLTIRDHTHPVILAADFGGVVQDPYGQTKAGFELTGKISRKDFGLLWNAVTEAGGAVVSDEVRLHINVQLVKKA